MCPWCCVGNLSRDLNEGELREAFAAFGDVASAAISKDKFSGETRGFGFVEMPNKEEADKAIAGLNGKDLKGRTMMVNEARPRTDKPRAGAKCLRRMVAARHAFLDTRPRADISFG